MYKYKYIFYDLTPIGATDWYMLGDVYTNPSNGVYTRIADVLERYMMFDQLSHLFVNNRIVTKGTANLEGWWLANTTFEEIDAAYKSFKLAATVRFFAKIDKKNVDNLGIVCSLRGTQYSMRQLPRWRSEILNKSVDKLKML